MIGSVQQGSPATPEMGLPDIAAAVRRRWRWIALPTLMAFGLSLVGVNMLTPRYTGEAKILLESRDSFYTRPAADQRDVAASFDSEAVQSQVQVVMSRDLAREAIRRLGLVGNSEFDPLMSGVSTSRKVLVLLGLARNPVERAPEERVLEQYYDNLSVYAAGRSRILAVEFRSANPELAARAANVVSELYLEAQEAAKKDTARNASAWLSTNIDSLRKRVTEAEGKVEAFRAGNGLLSGGTGTATITAQQLSDLSGQLANARTAHADAQAKAKLIRDMIRSGRSFEIPDVANNELIRRLIEQRVNLRAQLALEMRTLLDGHPRIKELNAQLADLEGQIRAAAERTVRSLENEAKLAATRVDSILAVMDSQKRQVAEANESEVQLRALEREAKTLREQLESYLARYREAIARDAENAAPPDARIISRAIVPTAPSFPKKTPIVAVATIGTFVMALGLVIGAELMGGENGRSMMAWRPAAFARREEPYMPMPQAPMPAAPASGWGTPVASSPMPGEGNPQASPGDAGGMSLEPGVPSAERIAQQVSRAPRAHPAVSARVTPAEVRPSPHAPAGFSASGVPAPQQAAGVSPVYLGTGEPDARIRAAIEAQWLPLPQAGLARRVMLVLPRGHRPTSSHARSRRCSRWIAARSTSSARRVWPILSWRLSEPMTRTGSASPMSWPGRPGSPR